MHANTPDERDRVGSECSSATLDPISVRGKMISSADSYHRLPIDNPGLTSQEGEDLRVLSWRLSPEARHLEYSGKEHREAWNKLGGPIQVG